MSVETAAPAAPSASAERVAATSERVASPDIATRAELNHLQDNRPAPVPEPALTPDSATTMSVNAQVQAQNARRAADLQERLQRVRSGMERDHALAQVNDRARADFDRAR